MATEKPEPRSPLILQIGVGAVITLVFIHAGLVSYFDKMASEEIQRKIGSAQPTSLMSLRADERARLTSGAVPIDQAMQKLSSQGRMSASPDIVPTASRDVAPEQGWSKMPQVVPPAMMAPPPAPPPAVVADAGGVWFATDAGKPGAAGPKPAAPNKKKP